MSALTAKPLPQLLRQRIPVTAPAWLSLQKCYCRRRASVPPILILNSKGYVAQAHLRGQNPGPPPKKNAAADLSQNGYGVLSFLLSLLLSASFPTLLLHTKKKAPEKSPNKYVSLVKPCRAVGQTDSDNCSKATTLD